MKKLLLLILLTQAPTDKGTVTGRILMPDGTPAVGVRVSAMALAEPNGPAAGTVLESLAQTDNSGNYRLDNVSPGRYYIAAGLIDAPTYFPGVTALSSATVVTIAARQTAADVNFSLLRPTRLKVGGKIVGFSPERFPRAFVTLFSRTGGSGPITNQVNADGSFEFANVPPGTYSLMTPSLQPLAINVIDRDVAGLELGTRIGDSNIRHSGLELAWSLDGTRGGVAGDPKTGLIYATAGGRPAQVLEIDLTGKIRLQIPLPPDAPGIPMLRIAHFAGNDHPVFLGFGIWSRDVRAYDFNGAQLWSYPAATGVDDVNVADLDGDKSDEVVIGLNGSLGVRVLDGKGQPVWQSTSIGNVWHVAAGDVLGTGSPQVTTTSAAGRIHVFSSDGAKRTDLDPGFYANMIRTGRIPETASTATVFAMGNSSAVNSTVSVAAISGDGATKWSLPLASRGAASVNSAWLATGKPWLAVGLRGGEVYVLDAVRGAIIASIGDQDSLSEIGWSPSENKDAPLLLISNASKLSAYRVREATK